MANTPTPRSYQQILGDSIGILLGKLGLNGLKVGGPILTLLETAAMGDARSNQDIFAGLASVDIDNAEGEALISIGLTEGVTQRQATYASCRTGILTDTSFVKVSTQIYSGKPAPIVGSTTIYVKDATGFGATGQLYLGRNTTNYEGPLTYTSVTEDISGNFWTIVLSGGTPTTKYHNHNESAIYAQGGTRSLNSGSVVTTAGTGTESVSFSILNDYTLPDGETTLENIAFVATKAGTSGNVPKGSVNVLQSIPFTGATFTNLTAINNALPAETDSEFRDRIKLVKNTRSKGTQNAIKQAVYGVQASDEAATVVSSSLLRKTGAIDTLYIDDGSGYEEKVVGIPTENVITDVYGGSQNFQLTGGTPVAKASVETLESAPYALGSGKTLRVLVGGVSSSITFGDASFRDITAATAYELVSAINADYTLLFSARTSGSGEKVVLYAKADVNDDIEVPLTTTTDNTANTYLGFPVGKISTLSLYQNNQLLSKDGIVPKVLSNSQTLWGTISTGATLYLVVDSIVLPVITFVDADFTALGYSGVAATVPLSAWVSVFNAKIPGVTASVNGTSVQLVSNLGTSDRANLEILSTSTLVASNMFDAQASVGAPNDYVFNRNTGEIHLTNPLAPGDNLSAGTAYTRGYLETESFATKTTGTGPNTTLWWCIDSAAQVIGNGATALTPLVLTGTNNADGFTAILTNAGSIFSDVEVGDYVIPWDTEFGTTTPSLLATSLNPAYVVSAASATSISFKVPSAVTGTTVNMLGSGLTVVRSSSRPVAVNLGVSTTYSASSLAIALNTALTAYGARAYNPQPTVCRVETNAYGSEGQVALVCVDTQGDLMGFAVGAGNSQTPSLAFNYSDTVQGTPEFNWDVASANGVDTGFPVGSTSDVTNYTISAFSGVSDNGATASSASRLLRGSWVQFADPVTDLATTPTAPARKLRRALSYYDFSGGGTSYTCTGPSVSLRWDRSIYLSKLALTSEDSLKAIFDNDSITKTFDIALGYFCKPANFNGLTSGFQTTMYVGVNAAFLNVDGSSLSAQFGTDADYFSGFKVLSKARGILGYPANAETTYSKGLLFRAKRYGPEGSFYNIRYVNPIAASQEVSLVATPGTYGPNIDIYLPSTVASTTETNGPRYALEYNGTTKQAILSAGYKMDITGAAGSGATATINGGGGWFGGTRVNVNAGEYMYIYGAAVAPNGLIQIVTSTPSTNTFTFTYVGGATAANEAGVKIIASDGNIPVTPLVQASRSILHIAAGASLNSALKSKGMRIITQDTGGLYYVVSCPDLGGSNVFETFKSINAPGNFSFFDIDINKTNTDATLPNLATRINTATTNNWVDAAIMNWSRLGVAKTNLYVTYSTADDFYINSLGTGTYTRLVGGYDYASGSDFSSPHHRLKINGLSEAALNWTNDGDIANERVYLIPTETSSLTRFLNTNAVSGLSANGSVSLTKGLQITSQTLGSDGSIQIVNNSANSTNIPVNSYSTLSSPNQYFKIDASLGTGLGGLQWAALNNVERMPLAKNWVTTTKLEVTAPGGVSTITRSVAGDAFTVSHGSVGSAVWNIERHGKFMCYVYSSNNAPASWGSVTEESQVVVGSGCDPANQGRFRVVRKLLVASGTVQNKQYAFWVENDSGIEELGALISSVEFYTPDSVLPGDTVSINTDILGASNRGDWLVATNVSANVITVTGTMTPTGVAVTLGNDVGQISILPQNPARMIKRVLGVAPDTDPTKLVVHLAGVDGARYFSPAAGTYITNLDKLGFLTDNQTAKDAYKVNTGLIAECNKILYGDETNTTSYPGVLANGDDLNISGPLVKRINLGIGIRLNQGTESEVVAAVQDAVAGVINTNYVGKAISLSSIVMAAAKVPGVESVVMLSPSMSSSTDTISVQAGEKTMALDPKNDILVSVLA